MTGGSTLGLGGINTGSSGRAGRWSRGSTTPASPAMRFTNASSCHSGAPGWLLAWLNEWEGAEEDANPVRSEDGMLLLNAGDNLDEEAESLAITGPPSACTAPVARRSRGIASLPWKLPLALDDTLVDA